MKLPLFFIILFVVSNCQGQTKTKKVPSTKSTSNNAIITEVKVGDSFIFPIIKLQDKSKSDEINAYMINAALGEEFTTANLKTKFIEQSKNSQGLSSVNYTVILNTATVLSLTISSCWVGASENCSAGQFNFDLTTGYNFTLDQIIMPTKWDELKKLVCNDSKKRLIDAKNEAKNEMGNSWYEKDFFGQSYESQWQTEYKKEYWGIELSKDFKLSKDGITFYLSSMDFLARVDRVYAPNSEYYYSWEILKPFFKKSSPISSLLK